MKTRLKLFSSFIALSAFSFLTAADLSALPENGWENPLSKSASNNTTRPASKEQVKNASSKPDEKGHYYAEVGAVYLRPYQGGTDFAQIVNSSDIFTGNLLTAQTPYGKNKALDFDFDWGVRGTLGYHFGKSKQTLRASYLYYQSDASKSVSSDFVDNFTPFNQAVHTTEASASILGEYFHSAHSHWNLHFNMLDLTFGRKYLRGSCMYLEPFVGAKGIIFSENQKSSFVGNSSGQSGKLKQTIHFEGVGIMGGINMDWVVTKWLSLFGSIDGALLYSSIKTKRSSDNALVTVLWTGNNHDVKGVGLLEGSFGIRGAYCMSKGRILDLKIGFEEHYLFQVMKHYILETDSSTDLSLMGWFATLGFEF